MTANETTDRAVQAFNLATGRELSLREGELFVRILEALQAKLARPDEETTAPKVCNEPAQLPSEQWLPGDILEFLGTHRANFSKGVHYSVAPQPRSLEGVCVTGRQGFIGSWSYPQADKDWSWVRRP